MIQRIVQNLFIILVCTATLADSEKRDRMLVKERYKESC